MTPRRLQRLAMSVAQNVRESVQARRGAVSFLLLFTATCGVEALAHLPPDKRVEAVFDAAPDG